MKKCCLFLLIALITVLVIGCKIEKINSPDADKKVSKKQPKAIGTYSDVSTKDITQTVIMFYHASLKKFNTDSKKV